MIPPSEAPSKILNTMEKICQAFEMGEKAFYRWVDLGLPVKKFNNRWCGHYDDIEKFMQSYLKEK